MKKQTVHSLDEFELQYNSHLINKKRVDRFKHINFEILKEFYKNNKPATQICKRCNRELPKNENYFYINKNGYMRHICKECEKLRQKSYYWGYKITPTVKMTDKEKIESLEKELKYYKMSEEHVSHNSALRAKIKKMMKSGKDFYCSICGEKLTDKNFSIDLKIPLKPLCEIGLSLDEIEHKDNLQLTHLSCNISKGAKINEEQIMGYLKRILST